MALLREGSEADFTPIVLPDVSITAGLCPLVLFSFTWFITKPWIFACAGFSAVFDLDSLEGSVLGVSFDVFFLQAACSYTPLNLLGVSLSTKVLAKANKGLIRSIAFEIVFVYHQWLSLRLSPLLTITTVSRGFTYVSYYP